MTTATLVGGFTYFEGLSVTPNTGPESGGTAITILGAGFDETTTALIGNVPVEDLVLVDSATLTGTTGVSTYGVYDVVTTTGTVVTLVTNGFTYTIDDTFALTSISPNYGSAVGGNTVTFTGTCFDSTTTFTIGGAAVTDVVIIDANTATGTVPAGTAGWVNVAAQQGVTESTLTQAYQYIGISITAVSPSFDYIAGGAAMQITGIGFLPNATITVGGAALLSPTIVSDTVITGTVPPGTLGPANVIATKGGSSFTTTDSFEYIASFTATDIDPPDGFVVGGDAVTITGTGFASTCTASIGGNPCSSVVVVSSTTITAVTPPGTEGAKDVVLSQYGGTATIDDGFTYVINDEDRKGDKPINETYNGLMFLPNGLSSDINTVLDANGVATPLGLKDGGVKIFGDLCSSGACLGYVSPQDNAVIPEGAGGPFDFIPLPTTPAGQYRNVSLALMLSQTLTPYHFGAKGQGYLSMNQDTAAFKAAIAFCSNGGYKLHIQNPGPVGNVDTPVEQRKFYCINETLVINNGFTLTSDVGANIVFVNITQNDAGFLITNGTPYSNNVRIGSYQFPTIKYMPMSAMAQLQYIDTSWPINGNGQTGNKRRINNDYSGVKIKDTAIVNVHVHYLAGWGQSIMMEAIQGTSPNYGQGAVYATNNMVSFVVSDLQNYGIYIKAAINSSVGDAMFRTTTIGVCYKACVMIESVQMTAAQKLDPENYRDGETFGNFIDVATCFPVLGCGVPIIYSPKALSKKNKFSVAYTFYQPIDA